MNVKAYIEYVKRLDLKTVINVNNVDLNDDIDNVSVVCSEDKNGRIIDLKRK